jgi:hypothetical protein
MTKPPAEARTRETGQREHSISPRIPEPSHR